MWLLRGSKGKERAVQVVEESARNQSQDDAHPRASSSSDASTFDAETAFYTLKYQRSHFLRLFGRKTLSARSSIDSLRSLRTVSSVSSLVDLVRNVPHTSPMSPADPYRYLPDLPIELWIYIFQLASNTAHSFLCSIADSPDSSTASYLPRPSPPISFLDYPGSRLHLVQAYKDMMAFKLTLTQVCKFWNSIGQVVLFEFIWIRSRDQAEKLVKLLDAKALKRFEKWEVKREERDIDGKESAGRTEGRDGVITTTKGKGRAKETGAVETFGWDVRDLGRHIRRIHVETSSSPFDQCSSDTILRIVEHATGLQVFSDCGSIRRNPRWSVSGVSSVVVGGAAAASTSTLPLVSSSNPSSTSLAPYSYTTTSVSTTTVSSQSSLSPSPSTSHCFNSTSAASSSTTIDSVPSSIDDSLLSALLVPKTKEDCSSLRHLSFTSYHHPCSRPSSEATESDIAQMCDSGIRYFESVVTPRLRLASEWLEYLELTLCAEDLDSGGLLDSLVGNARGGLGAGLAAGLGEPLSFPKLTSLKLTLDNAMLHVLSKWEMPALVNLSVVCADFSYAGDGFREFFEAHGSKLKQLELGHSTEAIEDHFAGSSPFAPHIPQAQSNADSTGTNGFTYAGMRVPLAEWSPLLEIFICSAHAEWSWQNPDRIAPHVLLPAHPNVELIGIRDLSSRLKESLERCERYDIPRAKKGSKAVGIEVRDEETGRERREQGDGAFFMLFEQFGSVFDRNAFPNLKYVRDLSWESAAMRRDGAGLGRVGGSALGLGSGSVDSRRDFGVGVVRDLLRGALRHSSHRRDTSTTESSQATERELREAEVARRLANQQHRRILRFWMRVLEKCEERGVYLEGCEGLNITVRDLRKAAALVG